LKRQKVEASLKRQSAPPEALRHTEAASSDPALPRPSKQTDMQCLHFFPRLARQVTTMALPLVSTPTFGHLLPPAPTVPASLPQCHSSPSVPLRASRVHTSGSNTACCSRHAAALPLVPTIVLALTCGSRSTALYRVVLVLPLTCLPLPCTLLPLHAAADVPPLVFSPYCDTVTAHYIIAGNSFDFQVLRVTRQYWRQFRLQGLFEFSDTSQVSDALLLRLC
jgi:hypothetical protein